MVQLARPVTRAIQTQCDTISNFVGHRLMGCYLIADTPLTATFLYFAPEETLIIKICKIEFSTPSQYVVPYWVDGDSRVKTRTLMNFVNSRFEMAMIFERPKKSKPLNLVYTYSLIKGTALTLEIDSIPVTIPNSSIVALLPLINSIVKFI